MCVYIKSNLNEGVFVKPLNDQLVGLVENHHF